MSLEDLHEQIISCRKCRLWQGAKHAVPGEGPTGARIMLVGQNPGSEEDETGRPFVGRSGKYLTKTLAENGIKREDLFITNKWKDEMIITDYKVHTTRIHRLHYRVNLDLLMTAIEVHYVLNHWLPRQLEAIRRWLNG